VFRPTIILYVPPILVDFSHAENADPVAVDRWRRITVEGIFMLNDNIDERIINAISTHLVSTLNVLFESRYTDPDPVYQALPNVKRDIILSIVGQAREISYGIQQTVSSKMVVTRASEDKTDSFGTYAFGFERNIGRKIKTVIDFKPITLQSIMG
jgi:hypothetical protein